MALCTWAQPMKWWRGKQAYHVDGDATMLTLYSPQMSRERERRELGFLVRMRDPRARPLGRWPSGKLMWSRWTRWRWVKVWAMWTNPALAAQRGRVMAVEIETHLTSPNGTRLTGKSYVRFKVARGTPRPRRHE